MVWMAAHWSHALRGVNATDGGRKFVYQLAAGIGPGRERLLNTLVTEDKWPSWFTLDQQRYLAHAVHDAAAVVLPVTWSLSKEQKFFTRVQKLVEARLMKTPAPFSVDIRFKGNKHWRNILDDVGRGGMLAGGLLLFDILNVVKAWEKWKKDKKADDAGLTEHLQMAGAIADSGMAVFQSSVTLFRCKKMLIRALGFRLRPDRSLPTSVFALRATTSQDDPQAGIL
jgi:hypothetical protein